MGAILQHLAGNVRQWVLSGLAGTPDVRERAREFTEASAAEAAPLLANLRAVVEEAAAYLETLDEQALTCTLPDSGLGGERHPRRRARVEHFAWHTGQAVWIAKTRGGEAHGLAFYDDEELNAARNG